VQRDLRKRDDVLFHARAVDVLIGFLPRFERKYGIVFVSKQLRGVIPRQPDAKSLFSFGSSVHLRHCRAASPQDDHERNTRGDSPPRYRLFLH